ncbi:MAG: phosphatase PAP2 family protein [Thermodesulfobacteriota bacterium]
MVLFFTLVTTLGPAFAEDSNDKFDLNIDKEYFKGYLTDGKSIVTSPARFGRDEWIKASLVLGGTVALYLFDDNIQDWTQDNKDSASEDISTFAEHFGDGLYLLGGMGGFYLLGQATKDVRANRTALLGLESFVITGLITQVFKFSFHRHRPKSGDSYDTWDGPSLDSDHLSFTSGHSAVAWSLATVVASEYKETRFVAPIAYTLATLASLSRVHDNKHWASDVFAGAALGYFTSKAIIAYHPRGTENTVRLLPEINEDGVKLTLNYRF